MEGGQPGSTVTHLIVAIWSSAWLPLPDCVAMRFFSILCVFGGFPALRLGVVSATGISAVLPATLTFKPDAINYGKICAADRFEPKSSAPRVPRSEASAIPFVACF
jgi:hypothetical protein